MNSWTIAARLVIVLGLLVPVGDARPAAAAPAAEAGALAQAVAEQPVASRESLRTSLGKLPVHFEPNRGQVDPAVDFIARGDAYTVFVAPEGAAFSLHKSTRAKRDSAADVVPAGFGMQLIGGNSQARPEMLQELPGKINYYVGADPDDWLTDIPTYARLRYREVYPGIDLLYRGNGRQLEYDFVVGPGADTTAINLAYPGADGLELNAQGDLLLSVGTGQMRQDKPLVYQEVDGVRREVAGGYMLDGQHVRFTIAAYDATQPLIIDPTLTYSTYLGGDGEDPSFGIALDPTGNIYVTGVSNSLSPGAKPFPLMATWGAEGGICCGGGDTGRAFVTKMNPTGTALMFSTYLGGFAGYNRARNPVCPLPEGCGGDARFARGWDSGFGIAADTAGNAYVVGHAESLDFPTTGDAVRKSHPGPTCCATPFAYGDHPRDGFLAKFSSTGALSYSSLIGGHGSDAAQSVAVVETGPGAGLYVAGITQSTDFFAPSLGTTNYPPVNAYQTQLNLNPTWATPGAAPPASCQDPANGTNNWSCWRDAFVMRLSLDGKSVTYSTLLGGTGDEGAYGIAVEAATGNATVVGESEATDFPTFPKDTNNSLVVQSCHNGNGGYPADLTIQTAGMPPFACHLSPSPQTADYPTQSKKPPVDAVVTRLGPTGALLYSTYLGGSDDDNSGATQDDKAGDFGKTVALDATGRAYVTGWTESYDSTKPATNPPGSPPGAINGRTNNCGPVPVGANAQTGNQPCPVNMGFPTTTGAFQTNLAQDPTTACGAGALPDCVPPNRRSHANAYLAVVDPTTASGAAQLVYSTYLGGFGDDAGFGVAVDSLGQAYVVGSTDSTNYPTVLNHTIVHPGCAPCGANINGVPPPYNPDTPPQFSDAFVTKVKPNIPAGSVPPASQLIYSTYLGGSGDEVAHGVVHTIPAGPHGVYVAGLTNSSTTAPPPKPPDPPGTNPPTPPWPSPWFAYPTTPDAFQKTSSPDRTIECNCGTPLPAVPNEETFIARINDNADEFPAPPAGSGSGPPAGPDFTLAASPSSLSINQGGSGTFTVSATPSGGFSGTVALTHSSTPAGLTVTPPSANAPGTFTASSSTPGTYSVSVTGTGGGKIHTTTVAVTVVAPDFSLAANPNALTFARDGGSGNFMVGVTAVGGFAQSVNLTASAPSGVTVTPTTASVAPPYSSSPSFQVTASTAGSFTITVTGIGGGKTHTTTVAVTVVAPDFSISANPTKVTVQPNANGVFTIGLASVSGTGWTGPVNLSVTTKPAAVTATLSGANPRAVPGTATLTLKSGTVGIYNVTLTATGTQNGTLSTHTVTVVFAVNQGGGCSGSC